MRDVVAELSRYTSVSVASLSRMEQLDHEPTVERQRMVAYLCCYVYGLAPTTLGLDDSDLPPVLLDAVRAAHITILAKPPRRRAVASKVEPAPVAKKPAPRRRKA